MLELFSAKSAVAAGAVGAISIILTAAGLLSNSTPIVITENGQVQGRIAYSRIGKEYLEYLGIPYAEPPIDNLRFEAPVKLQSPWKGVLQATKYPPVCLQFDAMVKGRLEGVEDCLQLNVFTYDVNPEKLKPVMVYIHGGGFGTGSSVMYGPQSLMDEDIVLVTFNYRLGPLGFLSLGDNSIRGNMGLKDQNLVLRWVENNIAAFGGNASQVTLFGESAGAASVQYHLISPMSQGLFQRAILQSGAVTCPWSFTTKPEEVAMKYIKLLSCPTDNRMELVKCLKTINVDEFVKLQINLMDPIADLSMFVPSIEPDDDEAFLTKNPRHLLKVGSFAKVPVMFGVLSGEGALRSARYEAMPERISFMEDDWCSVAPKILCYDDADETLAENTSKKLREYYFGNHSFSEDHHEFMKNFSKLNSDGLFFEPVRRAARLHAKQGSPTYLYYYDYDAAILPNFFSIFRAVRPDDWILSELKLASAILVDWFKENVFRIDSPYDYGATHADDLFQLWNMLGVSNLFAGKDYEFSRNFVRTFVDFARNEVPLQFNGISWPPIQYVPEEVGSATLSTPRLKYMKLDKYGEMIDEPFTERVKFWESLRIRESD